MLHQNLRVQADGIESWWRWTFYMQHAMRWDATDVARSLETKP